MAKVLQLSIVRTADGNGLPLPSYSSHYHVGLNLQIAVASAIRLEAGDRVYVPVGFAIGIPDGYCGFVVSRPELARQQGLVVLDAPQLISPVDRTPLFILLQNMSSHQVVLHRGDYIAQLVIQPAVQVFWNDLSGQIVSEEKQKTKDIFVDSMSFPEDHKSDKMSSTHRVYKSPRHRFSEKEENENEDS